MPGAPSEWRESPGTFGPDSLLRAGPAKTHGASSSLRKERHVHESSPAKAAGPTQGKERRKAMYALAFTGISALIYLVIALVLGISGTMLYIKKRRTEDIGNDS